MPRYVALLKWTDQGMRNVKDTAQRATAAQRVFEQGGGKLQVWYTLGEYDIVCLAEMPNDEAYLRAILAVTSVGNVRTTTLKAWTTEEFAKVAAQVP